jgi:TonB family protein
MKNGPLFLSALLLVPACTGSYPAFLGIPTVVSNTAVEFPPEVTNPEEVREAMRDGYPPLLRDAGIRGSVVLRLTLDETGQVEHTALEQDSGHRALDDLALELAKLIKFLPAQHDGERVPVLITIPLDLVPPPPGPAVKRVIRIGSSRSPS